ncbi:hypothetical protein J9303_17505 [Bacillaceae bacterium Marseille-Q3522]|nr:hypothetical protein [Bacillaceae bacterium Marseille-Q3522]
MIFEKTEINETQQLEQVKVTLNGVQYAEVIPTAGNEELFSNFGDSGIVALTAKFTIDNQTDIPLSIYDLGSKLKIDVDRGTVLSDGMAETLDPDEIQPGAQGVKYHVFFFRKDEFELFKKFDLEFGPFTGDDGQRLFKEKTVTFSLPR